MIFKIMAVQNKSGESNMCGYVKYAVLLLVLLVACDKNVDGGKVSTTSPSASSADAVSNDLIPEKFRIIEKVTYAGGKKFGVYDFILSIPEPWYDAGDYIKIEIVHDGKAVYSLRDDSGLEKYASSFFPSELAKKNLLSSRYLLLLPAEGRVDKLTLFVFGYQYASDPGSLRMIRLGGKEIAKEMQYFENFDIHEYKDISNDSYPELIGIEAYSDGGDVYVSYNPYRVYRFDNSNDGSAIYDEKLSERYNKKNYYGWAGAHYREDVVVVWHPPGKSKPQVMGIEEVERLHKEKKK